MENNFLTGSQNTHPPGSDELLVNGLKKWAVFEWLLILLPALVLIGWQFDIRILNMPMPGMNAMNPVTAITFLLCGVSFLLLRSPQPVKQNMGKMTSLIVLVVGLLRLLNSTTTLDTSIDLILFNSKLHNDGIVTRMAPNSAFNFILSAIALLTLNYETSRKRMPAQFISLMLFLASLLSVLIYFYRVEKFTGILAKVPMAPYTAICFLLVAFAILIANPGKGLMKELNGRYSGSVMARYLVPAAIIVPAILGYLRLLGGWHNIFSVEFGVSILVLTIIFFFLIMTWSIVVLLNRRDSIRQHSDQLIRQHEALVQNVFQSSPDALVIVKTDGIITLVNNQCETIFGYKQTELIGQRIELLIPERFHKNHPGQRESFFANPKARPMGIGLELFARRKDATEFPVEISLSPMQLPEGLLVSATIRDISDRKLLDEKIKFLATIADNLEDIVITTDNNSIITRWNHAAENLLEWKSVEVIGKVGTEILKVIYPYQTREQILSSFTDKGYWQGELIYHTKSGTPVNILATASKLKDVQGNGIGNLVLARDITERKKAETKVIESESLFSTLFYDSPVMNAISEISTGKYLQVNNTFANFLERPLEELIGKTSFELGMIIHPDEREKFFKQLQTSGFVRGIEMQINATSGKKRWVSINSNRVKLGGKDCFLSAVMDITLRKEAENALIKLNSELEQRVVERTADVIKSEKRFRALIENNHDIISLMDESFNIVYRSPSAVRITGWTDDDLKDSSGTKNIHPDDLGKAKILIQELMANPGKSFPASFRNQHKSGHYLWVEGTVINLLHDEDIKAIVFNFRDITQRKELENLLSKSNALARIGSWEVDLVKGTVYWSDITREIHETENEYEPDLEKGINFYKEKGRDVIREKVKEAITLGKPWDEELQIVTAKNNERWIRTIGETEFVGGKCVRIYGSFQDIDLRKKAEEKLAQEQALLRTLIDNLPDYIYVKDTQSRHLINNKANVELMGVSNEKETIGKTINDFLSAEIGTSFLEDDQMIFKTGTSIINREETLLSPTHDAKFLLTTKIPLRDENNSIIGLVGISRDITWLKQIEFDLREKTHSLEKEIEERKRAEHELLQSEAFNQGVINALSAHVAVINETGKIVAVNEAWERFALDNGETSLERTGVGSNYYDTCKKSSDAGDKSAATVSNGIRDVMSGSRPIFELEYPCHSPTQQRWFSLRVTNFSQGQPMVVLTHQDVTQRKIVEDKIKDSEDLFRSLYENSGEGILLTKTDGTILSANPAACKIFGRSEAEICRIGREGLVDLTDPRIAMGLEERRKTGRMSREWNFIRKDGTIFPGENTSTVFTNAKGEERASVFIRDITERKKDEQSLKDLSARLMLATRSAQIGIFDWDIPKNNLLWDENMYKIFDVPPDKFSGAFEAWSNTVHPDDIQNGLKEVEAAIAGTKDFHTIFRIFWRNQEVRHIEGQAIVLRDAAGNALRMIGVNRDITEQKIAEEEIKSLNQDLEKKVEERTLQLQAVNKELEAFSYSVSHDLRAPLRSIDGYSRILEEDYADKLDDDGKKVIATISRNAGRMGQLIDDMLSFSRYGRLELSFSSISMEDVVEPILRELILNEGNRVIKTQVNKLYNARGDIDMLRQVWFNYISNALKYSGKRKETEITIGSWVANHEVCYSIKDNGTGFNNKYVSKLFGVFQRLHKQSEFEGTGVGLATCKRIIERHGGRVWAEGEPDQGAIFYFSLPIK